MASAEKATSQRDSQQKLAAPSISLPKGGGAIRGIGEKFAANPVTGTGSMTVPIATSPGRLGFGPQLSLSYDSGAGNGPFGFGWSLSLPQITRKTDKGLPRYLDGQCQGPDSDVFILSGAEDLVPEFEKDVKGNWILQDGKHVIHDKERPVNGVTYKVRRYRPRIEGLFARIERWTDQNDPENCFWRSISRDNITTWYGKTADSRIADPVEPSRIFTWLISESYDDKGNVVIYEYQKEDSQRIFEDQHGQPAALPQESNRTDTSRSANRYLKWIKYGNKPSRLVEPDLSKLQWFFEVVLDYGEHDPDVPKPNDSGAWPSRPDPFSSYRAGFEVRTYRLCQRVLMFHHFPNEFDTPDCLVRSTDFTYRYEQDPADPRNPIYSFLVSVSQSGYKRQEGGYLKKSLPPLEFSYSPVTIQETIEEVDADSLENLPVGLDGARYQWIDLDGVGISGILTEQAGGWFYKSNLSPVAVRKEGGKERTVAEFSPVERVAQQPSMTGVSAGRQQFLDLAGDGQLDLVALNGPVSGFYERTLEQGWANFRSFSEMPNIPWDDPNLRFVDLTGDGHADVLITEHEVLTWYPSLAEEGFGPGERVQQALDEEKGPRLVFADGTQSIQLADLSGDGLSDLVRIRNGEVCYWPNLGYGRFGAKVTMDNAPWFDRPDQFDQKRIRLADIDGSGTTDIIYLAGDGVRIYYNQSGNKWSDAVVISHFPRIDDVSAVMAVDLLGNGTVCLVWSSPLPGAVGRFMRYIDLMGGQKPHLLIKTVNNLGAETMVQYAPSTKFYLADKLAGKPWITRLPFPVHCVEKVTVTDKWRSARFSSTYSYHHGYFDGIEREFRGFGRVDQVDVETFGEFAKGNADSPYITADKTLYQPPVKTVTWYHTGASLDREHVLGHFRDEYFPKWFEDLRPDETNVLGPFKEHALPEPDIEGANLTADEWREALRACKGMLLRQEVYELDVDALELGRELPVRLFITAFHNCNIRLLQPKAANRHAVFHVTESEAITYHYELDLRPITVEPDPRVAHTLNLRIDDYGNVQQSVAAVYSRKKPYSDSTLTPKDVTLINEVQGKVHLAYTENRYTDDDVYDDDYHRLPLACQSRNYELTGIQPVNGYFTLGQLRRYDLSDYYKDTDAPVKEPVTEIHYHEIADDVTPQKRLVEEKRMLFFDENLKTPLAFCRLNRRGLPYETYSLALTDALLTDIFKEKLTAEVQDGLSDAGTSGYLSGADLTKRLGADTSGQYWISSGIAGFADDAAQHFYLPERYTDPFGNETTLNFDQYDLYIQSSTDPVGNTVSVDQFDFRVFAPREMRDINDNRTEVWFDALGMVVASAVKGKMSNGLWQGDNLEGFTDELANPSVGAVTDFCTRSTLDEAQARAWLGNAGARFVYHFGERLDAGGKIIWNDRMAGACGIVREKHTGQLEAGEVSALQVSLECSDGAGNVLMKKVQAEPDPSLDPASAPLRWLVNGLTVLNNKGKPVKQYEPAFTPDFGCELPQANGVTPVMYYDAVGRLIRTELPNGSYSRVEFSPWHVTSFDPNDTVLEPDNAWYAKMTSGAATPEEKRAAALTDAHSDTPSLTIFDSLGRDVITIAHNRVEDPAGPVHVNGKTYRDEKYLTFTKLDAEGKPLWIRDPRGNLVMQYIFPAKADNDPGNEVPAASVTCYDIAGNLLFQHSMDAGDRWMLNDAAGQPMFGWDSRSNILSTTYDDLRRPEKIELRNEAHPDWIVVGLTQYGEGVSDDRVLNLRGKVYRTFDQSGLVTNVSFDFKGNPLELRRRLASDFSVDTNWESVETSSPDLEPESLLMPETFTQIIECDALNRITRQYNCHKGPGSRVAVHEFQYNERGLLRSEDVVINAIKTESGYADGTRMQAIKQLTYNAKGQRLSIAYGNNTATTYEYDPDTFRLNHLQSQRRTDNKTLQDLLYTYDPSGNISEIRDNAQPTVFFNNFQIDARNLYTYDALYRLIEAQGREHAGQLVFNNYDNWNDCPLRKKYNKNDAMAWRNYIERYEYDSVGNIIIVRHIAQGDTSNSWTRQYQYATASNRLLATGMGAAPVEHYADTPTLEYRYNYNTHGSMINMPHLATMDWDFTEHLQHISRAPETQGEGEEACPDASLEAWYRYDAAKERTRKRVIKQDGLVEERLYLGGFETFRKYDGSGTVSLERETLHIMDDKQRIALVETRTQGQDPAPQQLIRYQFGNHLGSASLELDDQGQIISYEEYYPYGTTSYQAVRSKTETPKRYRYTGKERDEESGLEYHSARYYVPWLGRWGSADSKGLVDGVNLFAYVSANPVSITDTTGHQGHFVRGPQLNPDAPYSMINLLHTGQGLEKLGLREIGDQPSSHGLFVATVPGNEEGISAESFKVDLQTITNPPERELTSDEEALLNPQEGVIENAFVLLPFHLIGPFFCGSPEGAESWSEFLNQVRPFPYHTEEEWKGAWLEMGMAALFEIGLMEALAASEAAISLESAAANRVVRSAGVEAGSPPGTPQNFPYWVRGGTKDVPTAQEAAEFQLGVWLEREPGRVDYRNGEWLFMLGEKRSIPGAPTGSDIVRTWHGHPPDTPALPSYADITYWQTGRFPSSAEHRITAYKFPQANLELKKLGEPIIPDLVTMSFEQRQVTAPGAVRIHPYLPF